MGPNKTGDPLRLFHPLIGQWFRENLGTPTEIQARAWPEIARGKHALITAPTGSGKTLTAFLWALNQLITGAWSPGQTRVLYVSPLKALNNDLQRNLLTPLEALKTGFQQAGAPFPDLKVLTRSGDTQPDERRKMIRRPPEILITTPESLNILISSRSGRSFLTGVVTVILDEIHALAGGKRGTYLITAVERLVLLSGEFQRLALSATARPLPVIADFIGGYRLMRSGAEPHYEKRQVEIIAAKEKKNIRVAVRLVPRDREDPEETSRWPALAAAFRELIHQQKTVLFFANSRRTAEKVTRLINEGQEKELAYAHHGSLSREIRLAVEQRLKHGELKAIVATSSLELGIDIGDLDLVVLIQTPPSMASALQRIGRSGHRVREESRGLLFPTHGQDLLLAAVMARAVQEQDLESLRPIAAPLDILAQVIIAMAGIESWEVEDLFSFIRTCAPFHLLSRRQFDLVLEMLAGRYAETRLRELKSRVSLDRIDRTVRGKAGSLRLLYLSGGTIPDRGYFDLRLADSRAKIGELDEEFVWERRIGDTFSLGTQVWRIRKVTHNDVEVLPVTKSSGLIPFWRAEDQSRDFHFSERLLHFLEDFQSRMDPALTGEWANPYGLEQSAAEALVAYLKSQQAAANAALPHRHHLLAEHLNDPLSPGGQKRLILHTLWGGRINRPYSLALQAAWEEKNGEFLEIIQNNDCLLLLLPQDSSAREILNLVNSENVERYLRKTLEKSGFFGARFRENAGRALLLPRADFRRRLPLWFNRLRAKRLLDRVSGYPDFPIVLETWRTCLQDEFDLEHLKQLLEEIQDGQIRISETATQTASPFAEGLIWQQTNHYMYADDTPGTRASRLSQELLKEVASSHQLRPRLPPAVIKSLEERLQRTAPGYAPRTPDDLLDWIKERLAIPAPEWEELLQAMARDKGLEVSGLALPPPEKWVRLNLTGASIPLICAAEMVGRIATLFGPSAKTLPSKPILFPDSLEGAVSPDRLADRILKKQEKEETADLGTFLLQWLSFYGPVRPAFLRETLGLEEARLDEALAPLAENQQVVLDQLSEKAEGLEICDRENLEIVLRLARRARQPSFQALPLEGLPLFLAVFQGLTQPGESVEDLQQVLDQLFGWPAGAEAWEKYILPARLSAYQGSWLDGLLNAGPLLWFGCGRKKTAFTLYDDRDLFMNVRKAERNDHETGSSPLGEDWARIFPGELGRYTFLDMLRHSRLDSPGLTKKLWDLVWQGKVSNDAYATLRQGLLTDFAPLPLTGAGGRPSMTAHNRWTATRPLTGHWFILDREPRDRDSIDEAELVKDRVRQLFRRYGLVFRELLAHEPPLLQWSRVFRALRLMELSGEILSGHFFEGISGLQFITPEAFQILNRPLPDDKVFWLNAVDPASLCGIHLESLKGPLPSRLPSNYLVYQGQRLVLIARRNGQVLDMRVPPDHPRMMEYLSFFKIFLNRDFSPEKFLLVEKINRTPALESPYAPALIAFGFTRSYKGLELTRTF